MLLSARTKRLSREVAKPTNGYCNGKLGSLLSRRPFRSWKRRSESGKRPYAAITTKSRRFDPVGIALKKSVMLPLRNTDVQRRGSSLPGYVPIHAHAIAVKPGRA